MSYSRLRGVGAIVTGGGSGIGRQICRLFAKEGANIAVVDVDEIGAQETVTLLQRDDPSKTHCAISGNVCKVDDVKSSLAMAKEAFGQKPNILINNAGILRGGLIDTVSEETFNAVIDVNLKAVYLMSKYFIASVKDSDEDVRGTIVNVSSIAGKQGFGVHSDYAAAKAGVIGLTKSIALEYHWHRVRCNALLPGFTDTPMADKQDRLLNKLVNNTVPMRRLAQPEEIANACLFLASKESSYVHGSCLEVSGGL